ncbi:MAG: hypothetical protein M1409_09070 [Actinobacteria bacterium]|nr:hypothetical protein [Actinomycetota bacterium]
MENIICCLNIKESYVRITNHFKGHPYISFEEYIDDIEEVKNKSLYKKWQYAVVDRKLPWFDEAVKFFKKNNIDIIYFYDDYKEVIASIKNKVTKPSEDDLDKNSGFSKEQGKDDTKVRYIEKPITKIVEKKIYTGIEKKLIIISSLTRCSGSTTITLSLAKYLSNLDILSSVIEPPIGNPAIFNWIGIEEREMGRSEDSSDEFYSYPHEISCGNRIKNKAEYMFDNIVWIIPDDRKERIEKWGYNQMLQLVYASNIAPITLIDIGDNLSHEAVKPLLSAVDLVLVVIDPFPTSCKINNNKFLELLKLKSDGCPVNFIINKWNSGIDKKEFLYFIQVKPLAFIPAIDLAILYKANCQYKIPLCYREVSDVMDSSLKDICSLFVPKEFSSTFSKNKKGKYRPLLANIIKKFRRS